MSVSAKSSCLQACVCFVVVILSACQTVPSESVLLPQDTVVLDSVRYTANLVEKKDSLVVAVTMMNQRDTQIVVRVDECVITLMAFSSSKDKKLVWDQREGLACPQVEILYKLGPGESKEIVQAISNSELVSKTGMLPLGNYYFAARIATMDYTPPIILAGTAQVP